MKLSKRLQCIFDMIPAGGIAADVGSDHGKLIISLFLEGKISKGYAIENKNGPFTRLKGEIEINKVDKNIIPLLSDGISKLPMEVDRVIVAGMGGYLISDILKSHQEKLENVEWIIVDPHNAIKEVREEITNLGYHIYDEEMIYEDQIYYEIILFKKGKGQELSELEKEFGPILLKKKSTLFKQKYEEKLKSIRDMIDKKAIPATKKAILEAKIKRIEEIL